MKYFICSYESIDTQFSLFRASDWHENRVVSFVSRLSISEAVWRCCNLYAPFLTLLDQSFEVVFPRLVRFILPISYPPIFILFVYLLYNFLFSYPLYLHREFSFIASKKKSPSLILPISPGSFLAKRTTLCFRLHRLIFFMSVPIFVLQSKLVKPSPLGARLLKLFSTIHLPPVTLISQSFHLTNFPNAFQQNFLDIIHFSSHVPYLYTCSWSNQSSSNFVLNWATYSLSLNYSNSTTLLTPFCTYTIS